MKLPVVITHRPSRPRWLWTPFATIRRSPNWPNATTCAPIGSRPGNGTWKIERPAGRLATHVLPQCLRGAHELTRPAGSLALEETVSWSNTSAAITV